MRYLCIILLLSIFCFAYDEQILDAQAQILPKIALLDRDIDKKVVNNKMVLVVACDNSDIEIAKNFITAIMNKTGGRVGQFQLKAVASDFAQLSRVDMSILYILNSSEGNIKKAINSAKQKGVVSFAYSKDLLDYGAVLSLQFERSSIVTLSRSAMKNNSLNFVESFYKIVRFVN